VSLGDILHMARDRAWLVAMLVERIEMTRADAEGVWEKKLFADLRAYEDSGAWRSSAQTFEVFLRSQSLVARNGVRSVRRQREI
jgi:hypothetical protein